MDIWSPRLAGAKFLELFAGSGAVGIEAVSRGASGLMLLDVDPQAVLQLHETIRSLGLPDVQVETARLPEDLLGRLLHLRREFDLIFADPPYAFDRYAELLQAMAGWLSPAGSLAVEHECREVPPDSCGDLRKVDERKYGDSCLSFYQLESRSQDCRK